MKYKVGDRIKIDASHANSRIRLSEGLKLYQIYTIDTINSDGDIGVVSPKNGLQYWFSSGWILVKKWDISYEGKNG